MLTYFKHPRLKYRLDTSSYYFDGSDERIGDESIAEHLRMPGYEGILDDILECRRERFKLARGRVVGNYYFDSIPGVEAAIVINTMKVHLRRPPRGKWVIFDITDSVTPFAETPDEIKGLLVIDAWIKFFRDSYSESE